MEIHKEILVIPATSDYYASLNEAFKQPQGFLKRGRSINFSMPFKRWPAPADKAGGQPELAEADYFGIITIVDRGRSQACAKAARAAGAKDALLVHGRGAGVPVDFYFPLVIEPQKDIVLVITTKEKVAQIRDRISVDLELEKVGNGILFTLPVIEPFGLAENGP